MLALKPAKSVALLRVIAMQVKNVLVMVFDPFIDH